ncbi:CoA ester lyase [Roseomonas sp. NAR14]|uniref:CoA ester lyase n=1 Tax=Roseomonas acroporae TaxID=2937791 RepID=A0A9X2BVT5_9PROT|nr:CoA ester lyase [Roseomonas acroporae]MCK8787002.1 CoA ester lyase [Roseomonas acroporae]
MTDRTLPPWRSLLYCPAGTEKFVAKAHMRGADAIILDLEDAVAPPQKPAARAGLREAARRVGQPFEGRAGADVCVRINRPLDLAVADIEAAVCREVTALVLPKLIGPDHVRLLAELVAAREAAEGLPAGHVRFVGIVESAAALSQMEAIARADPRLVALSVGGEDLALDLGAEPSADSLFLPKMLGLVAARAAGVLPLGFIGTVAGISDPEGYRAALRRSRGLGFACTSCVHPAQVPVINEEYGPSEAEVSRARRMVAAFEESLARGIGAVAFEGQMIDLPVVERARRLLARL